MSQATVLRLLRDEGLILQANYQRERRQLAARRKAALATGPTEPTEPTEPNQVWQLDFSGLIIGPRPSPEIPDASQAVDHSAGYWSKYERGWHTSPTANCRDAIAAVEAALVEAERLAGAPAGGPGPPG